MTKLKKLKFGFFEWFLFLAHTYHIIQSYTTQGISGKFIPNFETFFSIIFSYITVFTLIGLIHIATEKWRWLNVSAKLLYLLAYSLSSAYLFQVKHSTDFSMLFESGTNAWTRGTWEVFTTSLDPVAIKIGLIAIGLFLIGELLFKAVSKYSQFPNDRKTIVILILIYAVAIFGPGERKDEVTHFIRSIYTYTFNPNIPKVKLDPSQYPFIQSNFEYTTQLPPIDPNNRPNVFIIVIESFNQWAVEQKTENGQVITPYFNQLIQNGLYIDRFYGNSMLSIKGYGAIFGGILPTYKGFVLDEKTQLNLQGFPKVFHDSGYRTLFFQAQEEANFHYTDTFMKKTGFEDFKTLKPFVKPEDDAFKRYWGYEDHILYKHFFQYLDTVHEEDMKNGIKRPYFNAVVTIYNHMRFIAPPERRKIHKEPKNQREHFSNTIHLTDESLQVFFNELQKRPYLKNSIIVITGDHSFPLGDHNIDHAEIGFYDESFRVPFLLLWDNKIKPERVKDRVYSQIDIGPTLIDLAKVSVNSHHFQGRSMFAPYHQDPILLVQPFSGTYLESVRYPLKYIYHVRSKKEYVFDLEKDPKENHNLIQSPEIAQSLIQLRKDLHTLYLNQYAINHNQIWKENKAHLSKRTDAL